MKEKLREHIQALFADAERSSPNNQRLTELKEELLLNTQERYDHMISLGKSPEAAYVAVINGIGDITELLDDMTKEKPAREGGPSPAPAVPPAETVGVEDGGEDGCEDDGNHEKNDEGKAGGKEKRPRRSKWYGLVSGIIWTVVLCAYFTVSFETHAWSVTWLLFIMGIATDNIAKGIFDLRR